MTRSPHQASELAERLRARGLEPVPIPAIELAEPGSYEALDAALAHLGRFDWLLFTSANAVDAFHRRLAEVGDPARSLQDAVGRLRIAVIGPSTARALEALGVAVDLVPPQAVAESMASSLKRYALQPDGRATRFLLVRAEEGREVLPEALRGSGADVTVAPAYRTVLPESSVNLVREIFGPGAGGSAWDRGQIDAITFTSSSSARNLLALFDAAGIAMPSGVILASIGPVTSSTLRELGYPPTIESQVASVDALANAVAEALRQRA